jgi:hypothetical protein
MSTPSEISKEACVCLNACGWIWGEAVPLRKGCQPLCQAVRVHRLPLQFLFNPLFRHTGFRSPCHLKIFQAPAIGPAPSADANLVAYDLPFLGVAE